MYLDGQQQHAVRPVQPDYAHGKPITTVFIDHVLPKIDLDIEHVLIGVEKGDVGVTLPDVPVWVRATTMRLVRPTTMRS